MRGNLWCGILKRGCFNSYLGIFLTKKEKREKCQFLKQNRGPQQVHVADPALLVHFLFNFIFIVSLSIINMFSCFSTWSAVQKFSGVRRLKNNFFWIQENP